MEPSNYRVLPILGMFIFFIIFGPPIGVYVLVHLIKSDFNDGPEIYFFYGQIIGLIPAFIASILNLIYLKYLFKLNDNPNLFYCIFVGALAGVTTGVFFYFSIGLDQLNFFKFILVFCIPSTILGLFNKIVYSNTPNKKINKDT
jgi:hypothetical protein